MAIKTASIAPVASELHNSAKPTFPPESRSAIMPEPTMAARRKAVPRPSAMSRRARLVGCNGLCRLLRCGRSRVTDLVELFLQRQLAQLVKGEVDEDANAIAQHAQSVGEGEVSLRISTFGFRSIGKAPMGGHWLARPDRTDLLRRVVADGKTKSSCGASGPANSSHDFERKLEVS
jgi:hypothetical protein